MTATLEKVSIGGVKKARINGKKVLTAHDLLSGYVVYFSEDEGWSQNLEKASVYEGQEALQALNMALANEDNIVGPYLMDVSEDELIPAGRGALRENIRLAGPTVTSDYSQLLH